MGVGLMCALTFVVVGCADNKSDEQRVTDGIKRLLATPPREGVGDPRALVGQLTAIQCNQAEDRRDGRETGWTCEVRFRDGRRAQCGARLVGSELADITCVKRPS